jgi:hypothetical protein
VLETAFQTESYGATLKESPYVISLSEESKLADLKSTVLNITDKGVEYELEVIPKAGEIVYLVNIDAKEIYKVEVYAIGKDFFIPKNVETWKPEWKEVRFDEYGKRWFLGLENAKRCLEGYLTDDETIEEGGDDWWIAMKL